MKIFRLLPLLALLILARPAQAKFMRPDVEKIPVDRLITNLETQVAQAPENTTKRYALGRLHAMAFWRGQFEADQSRSTSLPWFGYCDHFTMEGQPQVPNAEAREHLKKAVAYLRQVTQQDTNHLVAALGLGWCLEQAGDLPAALAQYRKVVAQAWKSEEAGHGIGPCGSMTEEACGYLLPRLDKTADAAEIARLNGIQEKLKQMPRAMTPILLPVGKETDLDHLIDSDARVVFDLDGSGVEHPWQWIRPNAAWLVFDYDGRGEITSGLQMAGAVAFWIFWDNGYAALSALDADNNSVLEGAELDGLALWRDANRNGQSEPGEVRPLRDYGIIRLQCLPQTHSTGIPYHPAGAALKNGSTLPTYDWTAKTSP
jgi:hypothetical protein